jgi:hypothetical protein
MNLSVTNEVILPGQDKCYNAQQTITVGGDGSIFSVQPGGNATFIAGQTIKIYNNFLVYQGGTLNAKILPNGPFCGAQPKAMVNPPANQEQDDGITQEESFRVYPNPTSGEFTVDWNISEKNVSADLVIYRLTGEIILRRSISANVPNRFNISGMTPGIYLLRIISENKAETKKIVLQ